MGPLGVEDRARVFISCGQRANSDEVVIATAVEERLRAAGFDPYVATAEQSLRALRENLFPRLTDAEYFLFIDFRREQFPGPDRQYRGSLFSHQELAIASFLDKEFIGFQEEGVKREGLLGYLQSNCTPFSDRASLPDLVLSEVCRRGWDPRWQNRLQVEIHDPPFDDVPLESGAVGRFFHLRVTNRHRHRTAHNCAGYIRSVVDNRTGQPVDFESVELKWAGYSFPTATISPRAWRSLDAFWLPYADPLSPRFKCFADWDKLLPRFGGPGDWTLTYEVVSESVPGHTAALRVILASTLDGVAVRPA